MKRVLITINLTKPMSNEIDYLLATGLFGFTREDVAERLLAEQLRIVEPPDWARDEADLEDNT